MLKVGERSRYKFPLPLDLLPCAQSWRCLSFRCMSLGGNFSLGTARRVAVSAATGGRICQSVYPIHGPADGRHAAVRSYGSGGVRGQCRATRVLMPLALLCPLRSLYRGGARQTRQTTLRQTVGTSVSCIPQNLLRPKPDLY